MMLTTKDLTSYTDKQRNYYKILNFIDCETILIGNNLNTCSSQCDRKANAIKINWRHSFLKGQIKE